MFHIAVPKLEKTSSNWVNTNKANRELHVRRSVINVMLHVSPVRRRAGCQSWWAGEKDWKKVHWRMDVKCLQQKQSKHERKLQRRCSQHESMWSFNELSVKLLNICTGWGLYEGKWVSLCGYWVKSVKDREVEITAWRELCELLFGSNKRC